MAQNKIEPVLHVEYCVIAYDDSGYGENRSREFTSGEEAVAYARSLSDNYHPQVFKRITMDPISQMIYDFRDKEAPQEAPLNITPISRVNGSYRTGGIIGLSKTQIDNILGFTSNVVDDPDKVKYSWAFTVRGSTCAIWDWKGSHKYKEFSAFGPADALKAVFGDHYVNS